MTYMASFNALQLAAYHGDIARMKHFLDQGASITERDADGWSVLEYAATNSRYTAMWWLLTDAGAILSKEGNNAHDTIWDTLQFPSQNSYAAQSPLATELSALLKVMVMLEDAPSTFVARLSPKHAKLCTQGWQLRAHLPSYRDRQKAKIVAHCPLPSVLQVLVISYAATTPEDMWANGLRVEAPKEKRARDAEPEAERGSHTSRRSARLRQKHVD
jgi:hypothetical protein